MRKSKWLKWIIGSAIILIIVLIVEDVRATEKVQLTGFWSSFPTWIVVRVLGLISYGFIFIGISLGIIYSMPIWKGKIKANLYKLHSIVTISGLFCGMLHPILLVIDQYLTFSWLELLIPFIAPSKPILYGFGTLTVYCMLIILLSTDLRSKLSKKVWHTIHMGAYPVYILALAHGILGGIDAKNIWIFLMYVISFSFILILMTIQMMLINKKKRQNKLNHLSDTNLIKRLENRF
ncbi:hypothetical protein [Bacillus sp. 03113]|uniref:hypothetical protein n=1 Tax=Bacillus sp. 03113 TaxID=2578211 RepID=UPI0015E8AB67|nr:hypothetical protein [Bacillus sp. 03113]